MRVQKVRSVREMPDPAGTLASGNNEQKKQHQNQRRTKRREPRTRRLGPAGQSSAARPPSGTHSIRLVLFLRPRLISDESGNDMHLHVISMLGIISQCRNRERPKKTPVDGPRPRIAISIPLISSCFYSIHSGHLLPFISAFFVVFTPPNNVR